MKAGPGLRSGINRSSSLSLVIHGIPSSFRRRPESRGVGRGDCSAGACPSLGRAARSRTLLARRTTIFILLCGLRKAMVIPAEAGIQGEGNGNQPTLAPRNSPNQEPSN